MSRNIRMARIMRRIRGKQQRRVIKLDSTSTYLTFLRTTRNHNTVNHNQGSEDAVGKKSVGRNEFLHYEDARRRLEEEIKKKVTGSGKPTGPSVTGKCPPSTFPKPGVSPRRSSLQFTQSQSLKVGVRPGAFCFSVFCISMKSDFLLFIVCTAGISAQSEEICWRRVRLQSGRQQS